MQLNNLLDVCVSAMKKSSWHSSFEIHEVKTNNKYFSVFFKSEKFNIIEARIPFEEFLILNEEEIALIFDDVLKQGYGSKYRV